MSVAQRLRPARPMDMRPGQRRTIAAGDGLHRFIWRQRLGRRPGQWFWRRMGLFRPELLSKHQRMLQMRKNHPSTTNARQASCEAHRAWGVPVTRSDLACRLTMHPWGHRVKSFRAVLSVARLMNGPRLRLQDFALIKMQNDLPTPQAHAEQHQERIRMHLEFAETGT